MTQEQYIQTNTLKMYFVQIYKFIYLNNYTSDKCAIMLF